MGIKNTFALSMGLIILCVLYGCGVGTTFSNGPYAYISDFNGNKILQCSVNPNNGYLQNCQNIAQVNTLNAPTGIAIKNNQIYVNNS